jgi:cysteine desulfurase
MEMMTVNYGNPSSLHTMGFRAEKEITAARTKIAAVLGAKPEEIYFTSGGTESNNIALFGAAYARRKRGFRIVTTMIEHPSVLNTVKQLEKEGFEVVYLRPDGQGRIQPEQVFEAVNPDTVLVSMMCVNNEVGTLLPLAAVPAAIAAANAPALFHVDAVQAFGKLALNPARLKIDLMSVSAHKIHGPKGVGALYVRKGIHIVPRSYGGGQEKEIRPGTESAPLIAGFGAAADALPNLEAERKAVAELNGYLREQLNKIKGVMLNSPEDALPYILNLSNGSIRAETMLHYLADKGVYVSSGSACSKGKASHVLTAMGLPRERIASSLRLSFSRYSTMEEADRFLQAFKSGLEELTKRPF